MGREAGGGFRMGNTCKSMADSCQYMAKPLRYCEAISLKLIKINEKINKNKKALDKGSQLALLLLLFSRSLVSDSATPWTATLQASLFFISQSLFKLIFVESVMSSNQSHPLLSPSPPAFNLSQHQGLF